MKGITKSCPWGATSTSICRELTGKQLQSEGHVSPGGLSGLWTPGTPSLCQALAHAAVPHGSYATTVGATEDFQPSSAFPGCLLFLLKLWCIWGRNRVGGGVLDCEGAEENREVGGEPLGLAVPQGCFCCHFTCFLQGNYLWGFWLSSPHLFLGLPLLFHLYWQEISKHPSWQDMVLCAGDNQELSSCHSSPSQAAAVGRQTPEMQPAPSAFPASLRDMLWQLWPPCRQPLSCTLDTVGAVPATWSPWPAWPPAGQRLWPGSRWTAEPCSSTTPCAKGPGPCSEPTPGRRGTWGCAKQLPVSLSSRPQDGMQPAQQMNLTAVRGLWIKTKNLLDSICFKTEAQATSGNAFQSPLLSPSHQDRAVLASAVPPVLKACETWCPGQSPYWQPCTFWTFLFVPLQPNSFCHPPVTTLQAFPRHFPKQQPGYCSFKHCMRVPQGQEAGNSRKISVTLRVTE